MGLGGGIVGCAVRAGRSGRGLQISPSQPVPHPTHAGQGCQSREHGLPLRIVPGKPRRSGIHRHRRVHRGPGSQRRQHRQRRPGQRWPRRGVSRGIELHPVPPNAELPDLKRRLRGKLRLHERAKVRVQKPPMRGRWWQVCGERNRDRFPIQEDVPGVARQWRDRGNQRAFCTVRQAQAWHCRQQQQDGKQRSPHTQSLGGSRLQSDSFPPPCRLAQGTVEGRGNRVSAPRIGSVRVAWAVTGPLRTRASW